MRNKNLIEFKALIKRYETITLEEIEEALLEAKQESNDDPISLLKQTLTGFGRVDSCTLCIVIRGIIDGNCDRCVYSDDDGFDYMCGKFQNEETYDLINDAETPDELYLSYKKRARHMKALLKSKKL